MHIVALLIKIKEKGNIFCVSLKWLNNALFRRVHPLGTKNILYPTCVDCGASKKKTILLGLTPEAKLFTSGEHLKISRRNLENLASHPMTMYIT